MYSARSCHGSAREGGANEDERSLELLSPSIRFGAQIQNLGISLTAICDAITRSYLFCTVIVRS